MPIWLRSGFGKLWTYLTFRYTLVVAFCLWAMNVQIVYRVPGRFLFALLPLTGIALGILSLTILVSYFPSTIVSGEFRKTLDRLEKSAVLAIGLFFTYALLVYLNGKLDQSPPNYLTSEILTISGDEADIGSPITYTWVNLRSWRNPQQIERILLNGKEEGKLWGGEKVIVTSRKGYFNIPWVSEIKRDEDGYDLEVLRLAPASSSPLKNLINRYLGRHQWKEASERAHEYLKIYPNDYGLAHNVGATLSSSGEYKEALPFIEYVAKRKQDYQEIQLLGWTLNHLGENERAAEILVSSIPLNPNDWQAYYQLGYVYLDMGRYADALAAFENVLERQPDFPEIEQRTASLRKQFPAGVKQIKSIQQ